MNKIGTLDIIKAYLGNKELTANNAYIGEISLIKGSGPIPVDTRLRFEAVENSTFGLSKLASVSTVQYSIDGTNWNDLTTSSTVSLNAGEIAYLRGKITGNLSRSDYTQFIMSGKIAAKGNIMYLYDYETLPDTITYAYAFLYLFRGCTNLTSAPELPATTLTNRCYGYMFHTCSSLTSAPELPATNLAESCYERMFNSCISLTSAPELPATTLTNHCYDCMFIGCTNLTEAPALPATNLASYCYNTMFRNCTTLTKAPALPATSLTDSCYSSMFLGCTALSEAPALPATNLADRCYYGMFLNCTSLTEAPVLPARALVLQCYYGMFSGCSSLNKIITYAADISASNCLTNWVTNVSPTGDFYNLGSATYPSGASGIPTGWTEHTSL